ncbi:MAG: chaperone modulator CbpM [Rhodanobacteraceae bacterium]
MSMDKREFVTHCGVEVQALEVWLEQQWIVPEATPAGPAFSDVDAARVRLIQDLSGELGVNGAGVDVILHLVDQLHGLRRALAALRESDVKRN